VFFLDNKANVSCGVIIFFLRFGSFIFAEQHNYSAAEPGIQCLMKHPTVFLGSIPMSINTSLYENLLSSAIVIAPEWQLQ